MHKNAVGKLTVLLVEERETLDALAEKASEKQRAVVELRTADVERYSAEEGSLTRKLSALEETRVALFHESADRLGIEGEVNVESIAIAAGEPYATSLREAKTRIAVAAARLKKINEINRALLAQSLGHVHGILGLISRGGEEPTYRAEGVGKKAPTRTVSLVIDRRV